jgi:hypothetical protein
MSKKLTYLILEDESLILEYYCGQYSADELIDFKRRIGEDEKFNPDFNVISDIRELEFLFDVPQVKKYVDFLLNNKRYIGKRKTVMITRTPKQVVTSLGFDMLKKDLPVLFKVVSTFESAYNFIGLLDKVQVIVDRYFKQIRS